MKDIIWKPEFEEVDVEVMSSKSIHKGHFELKLHKLRFKKFSGDWSEWIEREQICIASSAAVVLYDPKKEVVIMIEQFRLGALEQQSSPWLLEIVAGYVEPGETPEQSVEREAWEEAHCKVEKLIPICEFYTTPGGSNERTSIFCGLCDSSNVEGIYGNAQEQEDIKVHVLPVKEVLRILEKGMLTSSSTMIGLQWLRDNRDQLHSLGYV